MADTWASLASLFVITYTSRCCAQHDSVVPMLRMRRVHATISQRILLIAYFKSTKIV